MDGIGRTIFASAALFVAVFAARIAVDDPAEGVLFLMVIPIALLALELKLAGGVAGALIATASIFAWIAINDIELGALGILTRTACFVTTGIGVGMLAARHERRTERLFELEQREERHQSALQVHEDILQKLAVAKMSLEMGEAERASTALGNALQSAQSFVSAGVDAKEGTLRTPSDQD